MKELYGLVLGGGKSRRMKEDKSMIEIEGVPLWKIQQNNIAPFVDKIFFSGPSKPDDSLNNIEDVIPDQGPLGGIYSALKAYPEHPFLVLPVDAYFTEPSVISKVIFERDPECHGTVLFDLKRNEVEPLMGIYEADCLEAIEKAMELGELSAKTFVNEQRFHWVQVNPTWINLNTPEDLGSIPHHRS